MKNKFRKLVGISLAAAMTVSLLPTTAFAENDKTAASEATANDNLLRIWYDEPATDWQTEALAIGNGYMGGLVYGGVASDKIHLNEKTVWDGGPSGNNSNGYNYGNTNPTDTEEDLQKIKTDLNTIREKLDDKSQYVFGYDENSYSSAGTGTNGDAMDDLNKLMGDLTGYAAPKDYASIFINSHDIDEGQVSGYIRDLDMRTALATVSYDYDGVHYTREYFNSYPDNVLVIRLTADKKGMIDFDTNLRSAFSFSASNTAEDDTITLRGSLGSNGLITEAQLKVIPEGGKMTVDGSSINITDADAATLILACGTDYKMELPTFRGEDPHAAVTERVNAAADKGYEALKEDHVADHSALFSRLEIGFNEEIPQIPTDELIQKYRNMVDNNGGKIPTEAEQRALEIICYQFGRYLTIAGSREGSLPTNLQGVWGEGGFTWYGDYHFNINIQMNYWPTLASNLAECQIPYNDFLDVLRVAGQGAVESAFGIENDNGENGWLVGCFSTPYMFASMGQKGNAAGWNPIGSAWALLNAYEYYLYTGDMDYLRDELYPSMKSVANFWDKALVWSDSQQRYVSSPSYSPENGPIVAGASYDQQFIWQHFENTIAAAETLGVDQDLIAQWREKQEKLNPVIVGDSGQIKEWYEETTFGKAQAGDLPEIDIPQWRVSLGASSGGQEPPHRHLSHLMALYPCNIISKDNTEYMDAAMVTLEERGLDATGWSKAHKLNLWARTGHSDEAFQIVQSAVGGGNSGFLTNLFSSHGSGANYKEYPIFQIDGNFGYTAGVNEMLLQSQLGYVQFLPTLPEEWNTGFVNGMVARGNFEIDMKWTDGVADSFVVTSRNGGEFTAEYADLSGYTVVDSQGNTVAAEALSNDKISFQTTEGESYTISKNGSAANEYQVTIAETTNGKATVPESTYIKDSNVIITTVPDEGYVVDKVIATDADNNEIHITDQGDGNYAFIMPGSNVTVSVSFKLTEQPAKPVYKITINETQNGQVSVPESTYCEDSSVIITTIPDEGYIVDKVSVTDTSDNVLTVTDQGNGKYAFTMPGSDVTISVSFKSKNNGGAPADPNKPSDQNNPDGSGDSGKTPNADKSGKTPQTGVDSPIMACSLFILVSLGTIAALLTVRFTRRRKH